MVNNKKKTLKKKLIFVGKSRFRIRIRNPVVRICGSVSKRYGSGKLLLDLRHSTDNSSIGRLFTALFMIISFSKEIYTEMYLINQRGIRPLLCRKFAKMIKMSKMSMWSDPVSDPIKICIIFQSIAGWLFRIRIRHRKMSRFISDVELRYNPGFCLPNCIMVGSRMNSSGRAHLVSFWRCLADRASLPWPSENGSGNANRSLNRKKM